MKNQINELIQKLEKDIEVLNNEVRAKSDKLAKLQLIVMELEKILKSGE